jgi:cytidylate kinase
LAFSGQIKSGKTSVSTLVSEMLGWHWASFGDYVREIARQASQDPIRQALQRIGEERVQSDPELFCRDTLAYSKWDGKSQLVVDGVRHVEVLGALHVVCRPLVVKLVYVRADHALRRERAGDADLSVLDSHSTEVEASELERRADFVVDTRGSAGPESSAHAVFDWVSENENARAT